MVQFLEFGGSDLVTDALTLERQKNTMAIVRLEATDRIPNWANVEVSEFITITRTADELSIVCNAGHVPGEVLAERDWVALKIAGPLAFDQVGIIASLAVVLEQAKVPIFVVSTYDTDYVLVRAIDVETAINALQKAGHSVRSPEGG